MRHWVQVVVILLVATGLPRTSVAQARVGQGAGHRSAGTGRAPQPSPAPSTANQSPARSPWPEARFTSRLMFAPPPSDVPQTGFSIYTPWLWGSLGFDVFWPWYTMRSDGIYQRPLESREGAPVGGLQLDVEPRRAQVYVDGSYAGLVEEFSGYYHHLDLPAGPHLIEIFEPGYQPFALEIVVSPGRTTTHRGTLTRAPGE